MKKLYFDKWNPTSTYYAYCFDGYQYLKLIIHFGQIIQYVLFDCKSIMFLNNSYNIQLNSNKYNQFRKLTGKIFADGNIVKNNLNKYSLPSQEVKEDHISINFDKHGNIPKIITISHKYDRQVCKLQKANMSILDKRMKILTFMKFLLPKEEEHKDLRANIKNLMFINYDSSYEYIDEYKKYTLPIIMSICKCLEHVTTLCLLKLKQVCDELIVLVENSKEISIINQKIKQIYHHISTNISSYNTFNTSYIPHELCPLISSHIIEKPYNVLLEEFLFNDVSYKVENEFILYFELYESESSEEEYDMFL